MDDRRRSDGGGSARLYVSNLTDRTREDTLREVFGAYGPVIDCKVITEYATGRSKGYAFVTFEDPREAAAAQKATHDILELDGKLVVVEYARGKDHTRERQSPPRTDRDYRAPPPARGYNESYDRRPAPAYAEPAPERGYDDRATYTDRRPYDDRREPVRYTEAAPPAARYDDRPPPRAAYDDRARSPPRQSGYGPIRSRDYRDAPAREAPPARDYPPRRDDRAYAPPANARYAAPAPAPAYDDYDRRAPPARAPARDRDYPPPAPAPARPPPRDYREPARDARGPPPRPRDDYDRGRDEYPRRR